MDQNIVFLSICLVLILLGLLHKKDTSFLLSVLILIAAGTIGAYLLHKRQYEQPTKGIANKVQQLQLTETTEISNILSNIQFLEKFNRSAFTALREKIDRLQKIYTYILGERYSCSVYLTEFTYQRKEVLRILYELTLSVPSVMKHKYGVIVDKKLQETIQQFRSASKLMLETLHRFCHSQYSFIPNTPDLTDAYNEKDIDLK